MKNNADKKTIVIVSLVFVAILAMMLLLIPAQRENEFRQKWGKLAELAETNEYAKFITENEELYPPEILNFFYNDPDDLEFVWGYPFHKDDYLSMTFTDEELHSEKVPALYMFDNRWRYQPIGDFYIEHHGCAAVSLTMAYLWLTGKDDIDPRKVAEIAENLDAVGILGGIEDKKIPLICNEMGLNSKEYSYCSGIEKTSHADIQTVKDVIDNGHVLLAGMSGKRFGVHMLIIVGYDDGDSFTINDPDSFENSERKWSFEELESEMMFLYDISKK